MAALVFVVGAAFALSIDVPQTGYGLKSDEATYVAATLSAAFDHDLAFDRWDLERFIALYGTGPQGIFLKRGKTLQIHVERHAPFVRIAKRPVAEPAPLYFGKAIIYPLFAAPFVRAFGLNGFFLFHLVLLLLAAVCGYLFLVAQSSSIAAATLTVAFLGASVMPVYAVFLMPEVFNYSVMFFAYFLWLYKEVAPPSQLTGRWTDLAAAALLGVGTYSKPIPIVVMVVPLIAFAAIRRHRRRAVAVAFVAAGTAAMLFGVNAWTTGEFNYQGGDRKSFYRAFPFDAPDATWDRRGGGVIEEPGPEILKVLRDWRGGSWGRLTQDGGHGGASSMSQTLR